MGCISTFDGSLYIVWLNFHVDYDVKTYATNDKGESVTAPEGFKQYIVSGFPSTLSAKEYSGYTFDYWVINGDKYYESTINYTFTLRVFNSEKVEIYNKVAKFDYIPGTIEAHYKQNACVAQGTLITLADGTQVPVESLTGNEMLMVWNMITGRIESASILFIDKDPAQVYKVINLGFSDGTDVKVISEHGFWDYDLNRYVYLDGNASRYIGHWFNKGETKVQLVSVDVSDEYTTPYSPVTYGHLCYYVNGMLSMPGGINGLFNIFEVDPDTMKINVESMQRDIAQYGLYTYEEFAELVPVSEDVFNAFNGQYLKVAVGKGLITIEQLNDLAVRYAEFFV